MNSLPIWWCIMKMEPIRPAMVGCWRFVKPIACEYDDERHLWVAHQELIRSDPGHQVMFFHRDPTDSPLLEASRRADRSLFGQDTIHDEWRETPETREHPFEYKDW